jgi:hypothetical protein
MILKNSFRGILCEDYKNGIERECTKGMKGDKGLDDESLPLHSLSDESPPRRGLQA